MPIPFEALPTADLIVDEVYEGGPQNHAGADPICKLLSGVGNSGGFRYPGRREQPRYVVLYSDGDNQDWPDSIDYQRGLFRYYGDNRRPGHELHDTPRGGNCILRNTYEQLHSMPPVRNLIPPFFIFWKHPTLNSQRSVQFKGLVAPGHPSLSQTEDLMAVWKTTGNRRFQNYRSVFTVLDIAVIDRPCLQELATNGGWAPGRAPAAWSEWIETGRYVALHAEPTTVIRTAAQQTPETPRKMAILAAIYEYFRNWSRGFEFFAALIYQMHDRRVLIDQITRGVVDGGRDAIGRYTLGLECDPVHVDFALEAKCYAPEIGGRHPTTVGVGDVARLISRLRHRQFGVLVTTSVVARQAYTEVRDDRHPIIIISGKDIVEILIGNGYSTPVQIRAFLETEFPRGGQQVR
ncbi:MAG: restriction endonuclease [Limisphaerales bacterium]